jgi:hypothetical protein
MTTIKFLPHGAITAEELKLRLNSRLHGNDPGLPYNWRGIR